VVFFINKRNIVDIGIYIQREIIYFTTHTASNTENIVIYLKQIK